MKKIGILTFHRAENYGAILQTYALQEYINNLDKENNAEIVDYRSSFIEEYYKLFSVRSLTKWRNLKRLVYVLIYNGTIISKRKLFDDFTNSFLRISEVTYYRDNITKSDEYYDLFICGSDQVWSPYSAGFDPSYFLDFVTNPHKKNAYAASFGVENIPSGFEEEYVNRLENFEIISVRETAGKDVVRKLINREAVEVLDPTFLLDKEEWSKIIGSKRIISQKYLLVYLITETKEILDMAKSIAKKNGWKVVYINDNIYKAKGVMNFTKSTPSEWLNLFYFADYIVTNSFHGIAFSINFEKLFSVQFLPEPAKVNSRISNILDICNLEWRVNYMDNIEIDYLEVKNTLLPKVIKSKKLLETILN